MKVFSNKKLLFHISLSLVIPIVIVLIESYTSRPDVILSQGVLKHIGVALAVPCFYIVALLAGPGYAANYLSQEGLFLLTNFIFYFVVIAVAQIIVLRKRKR